MRVTQYFHAESSSPLNFEIRLLGWNSLLQLYPTTDLGSVGIRDFDLDSLGKCIPKNGVSRSKRVSKPQPLSHQYWGVELRTSLTTVIAQGSNSQVRLLAEAVISGQQKEIDEMTALLG